MTVDTEEFFDTQREPSHVKSAIVSAYFSAWANIMIKTARQRTIGYLDLFAGKGRFEDGSDSTPILILKKALSDPALRDRARMALNDKDASLIASLKAAFIAITQDRPLKYPPQFFTHQVSLAIAQDLNDYRAIPTLLFADPFGYMGISLDLLKTLLRHPKSEGIIFFNTNRINAGLNNEFVREHIDALFGPERARTVREKVAHLHGEAREVVILDSFADALKSIGLRYIVRFRFLSRGADRTSHHLIHCSRHPLGEEIMKKIMDAHSVKSFDDVPAFEIPPEKSPQASLFEGLDPEPPRELADELARSFAGQTITFEDLFRRHSPGKNYVERNYRAALSLLVDADRIACDPPADTMRFRLEKRTWPKQTRIIFPRIRE